MEIPGCVQNGVVVLTNGTSLPEGAAVTVVFQPPERPARGDRNRASFPLVHSSRPGSVDLTSDRIAELLDDEDAPAGH
jgi:hypothetical protein